MKLSAARAADRTRLARAFAASLLIAASGTAAQTPRWTAEEAWLFGIAFQVRACMVIDPLLRKTCARIGPSAPADARASCTMPPLSFEERTAGSWRAFGEAHGETLRRLEPELENSMQRVRTSWQRQYAGMMAGGTFSLFDLGMLSREVQGCARAESMLQERWPRGK